MIERTQVEQWLRSAGLAFDEAELGAEGRATWAIAVEGHPFQTYIACRSAPLEGVAMEVHLGVSDEHRSTLASLVADDRDRFLFDLKIALLGRPVGFEVKTRADDPTPTAVVLGLTILEEPLTKAGFFRRHHQLQTSALLAATMFQKLHRFAQWR